jgi:hypothetical protein
VVEAVLMGRIGGGRDERREQADDQADGQNSNDSHDASS